MGTLQGNLKQQGFNQLINLQVRGLARIHLDEDERRMIGRLGELVAMLPESETRSALEELHQWFRDYDRSENVDHWMIPTEAREAAAVMTAIIDNRQKTVGPALSTSGQCGKERS